MYEESELNPNSQDLFIDTYSQASTQPPSSCHINSPEADVKLDINTYYSESDTESPSSSPVFKKRRWRPKANQCEHVIVISSQESNSSEQSDSYSPALDSLRYNQDCQTDLSGFTTNTRDKLFNKTVKASSKCHSFFQENTLADDFTTLYLEFTMAALKNIDVVKMYMEKGKKATSEWLLENAKSLQIPLADPRSFACLTNRLYEKHRQLQKSIQTSKGALLYETFCGENVIFPKPATTSNKRKSEISDTQNVKRLQGEAEVLKDVASSIAEEWHKSQSEKSELLTELCKTKEKLSVKVNKGKSVKKINMDMEILKSEKQQLSKINDHLRQQLKKKSDELKRLRSKANYWESQSKKQEQQCELVRDQLFTLREEFNQLTYEHEENIQQFNDSKNENDYLRDILNDEFNEPEIRVYDEERNRYSTELHSCVYSLLENHVSAVKVGPVINTVLKLVGKRANKVPSPSTIHNMNIQRLIISQKQIAEVVKDSEDTSLYTDETSKYGNKVGGYHVRNKEGRYFTLGLRDLTTKSGKDTLETFKEILEDIDRVADDTTSTTSKTILKNIRATMSDSASTEIKFNELLEEYRTTVLPYTVKNYYQLNEASKQSVDTLLNFFCGLHSLVHFADTSNKAIYDVEREMSNTKPPVPEQSFKKPGESGTARLIRTACKSFAKGADEKSGCHIQFTTHLGTFLKDHNMRSLKLVPYRGHRFNILFHNAGQVYMLHSEMINFLSGYNLNRLTKSVLEDLQEPLYLSGCKALGLISKFISTPLWNILEDRSIHILEMNRYYSMLFNGLRHASLNVNDFMTGQCKLFLDIPIKEDYVYECLVKESPYDDDCEAMLSVVLPALSKYVERKFVDFLEHGKFSAPTEDQIEVCKSLEKHNKFSEQVFAYYDNLLKFKPHIDTLASEAYITFSTNKTNEWLESKSQEETTKIVDEARHGVKEMRQKFKIRRDIITAKRLEKIHQQRQANEAAAAKKLKQQEKMTDDIVYHGLWQSCEQVELHLSTYQSKLSKVNALKSQLRFRKDILKQRPEDSAVFNFSTLKDGKRVQLSPEELENNLKTLVKHAFLLDERVEKSADSQLLKNKRVRHKFEEGGSEKWYHGKVISQVPGYPAFYNIVYDEDDSVYTYKLLMDYEKGWLEILL